MKNSIKHDPWNIIEEGFSDTNNEFSESIFSIGNGRMGQRANFEEQYSGKSLQGSYIAGVYYPDKTRVGWWKNGYPEYFAKIVNSVDWIGLHITIDNQILDLSMCEVVSFSRKLDMQKGVLYRSFIVRMSNGVEVEVNATRMYHMFQTETASLQYKIRILNGNASVVVSSSLNGDVINRDSNYDERFWTVCETSTDPRLQLRLETKKTGFQVEAQLATEFFMEGQRITEVSKGKNGNVLVCTLDSVLPKGIWLTIEKRVAIVTTTNHLQEELSELASVEMERLLNQSYDTLLEQQEKAWKEIWSESDIQIRGDIGAQQAIRFNIFQLMQTYTGEDARLNIGPKGFTGEKYGGVT